MRYFINQITNGKTEVVYQVSDEQHAQEFCDSRNSQLADKGIPSDICSWYVSGPFDPATF